MKKLNIGSRGSQLAVFQTEWVASELQKKNPDLEISFTRIKTTGDVRLNESLQSLGGKGVFVKEIEEALLEKKIDIAVHSLKDVPQSLPQGLSLGAFPLREDPRDAVISRFGEQLQELPKGSTIGTSSPRRRAQIFQRFKKRGYRVVPVRGNLDTRLKKLHNGDYDAIILAAAGLNRLGLSGEISQLLEVDEMMPAPGQGCLGIEFRSDDHEIEKLIDSIKDENSDITARAERSFLQAIGGNCSVPLGMSFKLTEKEIILEALLLDENGEKVIRVQEQGDIQNPELVGAKCAGRLLYEGGAELMIQLEENLKSPDEA